jgi:uncharacterized protein
MENATKVRSANAYRIIRQLHLWIGAWGALAAILFGFTGFLQNHRAVLKLPQGESIELSKSDIDVPEGARATPETVRDWLRDDRHIPIDNMRAQPGGADAGGQRNRGGGRWTFTGGNARLVWNAEYTPGGTTIQVRESEQTPLAIMSRLHKGVGGGVAWILLGDSFALALVALGLSGIYMWARGRSAKQMIVSVLGASLMALLVIGAAAIM